MISQCTSVLGFVSVNLREVRVSYLTPAAAVGRVASLNNLHIQVQSPLKLWTRLGFHCVKDLPKKLRPNLR